eukprot:TRINITY_DN6718_c0_g2_i5.p1 TRINITY_DN6718_c0_g2~~TRINITY_DN6718_c0_g2_i5.p1  ORF type:complete len:373 (-),score=146.99 TRINITY_DN6718_c0_g2_i5:83-1201(-)
MKLSKGESPLFHLDVGSLLRDGLGDGGLGVQRPLLAVVAQPMHLSSRLEVLARLLPSAKYVQMKAASATGLEAMTLDDAIVNAAVTLAGAKQPKLPIRLSDAAGTGVGSQSTLVAAEREPATVEPEQRPTRSSAASDAGVSMIDLDDDQSFNGLVAESPSLDKALAANEDLFARLRLEKLTHDEPAVERRANVNHSRRPSQLSDDDSASVFEVPNAASLHSSQSTNSSMPRSISQLFESDAYKRHQQQTEATARHQQQCQYEEEMERQRRKQAEQQALMLRLAASRQYHPSATALAPSMPGQQQQQQQQQQQSVPMPLHAQMFAPHPAAAVVMPSPFYGQMPPFAPQQQQVVAAAGAGQMFSASLLQQYQSA